MRSPLFSLVRPFREPEGPTEARAGCCRLAWTEPSGAEGVEEGHPREAALTRSLSSAEVVLCLSLLLVLAAFSGPVFRRNREGCCRTKCSSNLRQLGLAAVQYGDDKRFLPHLGSLRALDGDIRSSDTPRAVRALAWYGYHDNPEGFVCPQSDDVNLPIGDASVLENMRLWGYARDYAEPGDPRNTTSPFADQATRDPTLLETSELSFGLTRRGLTRNVASGVVLGADRSVRVEGDPGAKVSSPGDYGNHPDGWNVLNADCTVEFVASSVENYQRLAGLEKGQAALPLSDKARPF